MKITMYELLGMIKDGKQPKEIKYNGYLLSWDNVDKDYCCEKYEDLFTYLFTSEQTTSVLEEKVEILEEQKKETKPLTRKDIEALGYACGEIKKCFENGWNKSLENKPIEEQKKIPEKIEEEEIIEIRGIGEQICANKINEIIDYLKSKGE